MIDLSRKCRSSAVSRIRKGRGASKRFLPGVDALEGRALLSTLTVTSPLDDGSAGTLRYEVGLAGDGDTINFAAALSGKTIQLSQGPIDIDSGLTILGPGAAKLAIDGQSQSEIFDDDAAMPVTISGLTLKNGLNSVSEGGAIKDFGGPLSLGSCTFLNNEVSSSFYARGGAVYDYGSSLTVTNCTFNANRAQTTDDYQAAGGAIEVDAVSSAGIAVVLTGDAFSQNIASGIGTSNSDAQGGAVSIDAGFSAGASFTLTGDRFLENEAVGGPGSIGGTGDGGALALVADLAAFPRFTVSTDTFDDNGVYGGASSSYGDGAPAEGGAIWISAGFAANPLFAVSTDTVAFNFAIGGAGVDESGLTIPADGGNGGTGAGGGLYFDASDSAAAVLTVNAGTFVGNVALGGAAGGGGSSYTPGVAGGIGGEGGTAEGGGLMVDFDDASGPSVTLTRVVIASNGTYGDTGGSGGGAVVGSQGGAGGFGGPAEGGGLNGAFESYFDGVFTGGGASGTALTVSHCSISNNYTDAGAGGAGGNGGAGGVGGGGGDTFGGGIHLGDSSAPIPSGDTWTLDTDSVTGNRAQGGVGGSGGQGFAGSGGNGGSGGQAVGGGIDDEFNGVLNILHGTILRNIAAGGSKGLGGSGTSGAGVDGSVGASFGGGICIAVYDNTDGVPLVFLTRDTQVVSNSAEFGPQIFGSYGTK